MNKICTSLEQSKKLIELGIEDKIGMSNIIKTIENYLKNIDLSLYKDLGNGFYELPGNIITNQKGRDEYLEEFKKTIITEENNAYEHH